MHPGCGPHHHPGLDDPAPAARAVALRAALELAAYAHAGPNWVARGTVSPTSGTVGGDVHR